MTSLKGRPNTALLVVDVQNGVVGEAFDRDAVVGRIAALVDRAREAGVAVVWVQHSSEELTRGSQAWQLVPELLRRASEKVVHKKHGDAFEGTRLEQVLAGLGIGHLVVSGAETGACIRSTMHGGFARGYDVTLVADAHTTNDLSAWGAPPPRVEIDYTNLYWQYETAPRRRARVVATDEVDFGPGGC